MKIVKTFLYEFFMRFFQLDTRNIINEDITYEGKEMRVIGFNGTVYYTKSNRNFKVHFTPRTSNIRSDRRWWEFSSENNYSENM